MSPDDASAGAEAPPSWLGELVLRTEGPPWLAMGLGRVPESAWLLPDQRRAVELAERRRLLRDRHQEVVGTRPGTEAAGAEVLELVRAWEARHRPDLADGDDGDGGDEPHDPVADGAVHPLEQAGRRTQEDLVLMVPRDGSYHLDAAVLCFPSHWRLAHKLGGSALAIHEPVPHYRDDLASRVDRYLERLRPDVIGARRNWSVHDSPALFAPDPPADPRLAEAHEVGTRFWLRSERQTLRRLPRTGAVLFTIRVQQAPFDALRRRPDVALALADRVAAQPGELTEMNGLAPHRDVVVAWLREIAAGTAGARP